MKFTKMQAYGNDYVYVSLLDQEMTDPEKWAVFVSDRHKGIGSDGMILVCPSEAADFKMRIFNPDGSEAEMCGNGLRSVGKFVFAKGYTDKTDFTVETLGGIKRVHLWVENGLVVNVSANIGVPVLEADKIPVTLTNKGNTLVGCDYTVIDKPFRLTAVSLGNPHCGAECENVFELNTEKYGPALETADIFPRKANIHFYEVIDRHNINMRSWERNCGETLACATGCSTAVYSAILNGKVSNSVDVHQRGGVVHIDYNDEDGTVTMTGKAEIVFDGYIENSVIEGI
ncbi:MAG: diaminopimelate epimerase [Eubacteriales bacterium]|nr:diaminopimelate epimerase [Eubacteriales bacterium]